VHPERGFEFGYWLGRRYWGRGYATEAARRALAFAFTELNAERLTAGWFHDNPASGRVLEKLGFVADGMDERVSLSRRCSVACNKVTLTRAAWAQRKGLP
jgi:[ribosomal protein S5]-alanine N-acetyltransferase